jgi:putative flippase GtrA
MKTGLQLLKFGLVGGVNTFVHYVIFVFLFRIVGAEMMVSSAIGYLAGLVNSFFLNRKWTFKVEGKNQRQEFVKFFCVNILSLALNLLLLKILVSVFVILPEIAQLLAIFASLVVNFAGNKWWTFRHSAGSLSSVD